MNSWEEEEGETEHGNGADAHQALASRARTASREENLPCKHQTNGTARLGPTHSATQGGWNGLDKSSSLFLSVSLSISTSDHFSLFNSLAWAVRFSPHLMAESSLSPDFPPLSVLQLQPLRVSASSWQSLVAVFFSICFLHRSRCCAHTALHTSLTSRHLCAHAPWISMFAWKRESICLCPDTCAYVQHTHILSLIFEHVCPVLLAVSVTHTRFDSWLADTPPTFVTATTEDTVKLSGGVWSQYWTYEISIILIRWINIFKRAWSVFVSVSMYSMCCPLVRHSQFASTCSPTSSSWSIS